MSFIAFQLKLLLSLHLLFHTQTHTYRNRCMLKTFYFNIYKNAKKVPYKYRCGCGRWLRWGRKHMGRVSLWARWAWKTAKVHRTFSLKHTHVCKYLCVSLCMCVWSHNHIKYEKPREWEFFPNKIFMLDNLLIIPCQAVFTIFTILPHFEVATSYKYECKSTCVCVEDFSLRLATKLMKLSHVDALEWASLSTFKMHCVAKLTTTVLSNVYAGVWVQVFVCVIKGSARNKQVNSNSCWRL